MFDDRENIIGVLLLALCAVVGGVLVYSIVTGERLTYSGPQWLAWLIGALFLGAIVYGVWQNMGARRRSGGTPQWPAPDSGRRPWWKFWDR